jgi:hypothetical protein
MEDTQADRTAPTRPPLTHQEGGRRAALRETDAFDRRHLIEARSDQENAGEPCIAAADMTPAWARRLCTVAATRENAVHIAR